MATVYRLNYQPQADTNWDVNPGNCTEMSGFAHDYNGDLLTIEQESAFGTFAITGTDVLHAEVFAGPTGASRFIVFRVGDIDEYTSGGSRTNRATGLSASTESWGATSWGSQIIACNYLNNTQSSTSGAFSSLGGGSPKARRIASTVNFVMLADVDDGGSNVYGDMVWWSAIRNPSSWTPSLATQAGNYRLLDTPGNITALATLGDKFVAFKKDSVYLGRYVGPPYVFEWRVVSDSVGCWYPRSVAYLDGRLYFVSKTGVYAFDGAQFELISNGVFESITSDSYNDSQYNIHCCADEINGTLWVFSNNSTVSTYTQHHLYAHPYNVRARMWARSGLICSSTAAANGSRPVYVSGGAGEKYSFTSTWGTRGGFQWIDNAASAKVACCVVGSGNDTVGGSTLTTGYIGSNEFAPTTTRVWVRNLSGSAPDWSVQIEGYKADANISATTTVTANWNSGSYTFDGVVNAKFIKIILANTDTSENLRCKGIGVMQSSGGKML